MSSITAQPPLLQDRATIAGQFWPESGDGQALTNLRREMHQARQASELHRDEELLATDRGIDKCRQHVLTGLKAQVIAAGVGVHRPSLPSSSSSFADFAQVI